MSRFYLLFLALFSTTCAAPPLDRGGNNTAVVAPPDEHVVGVKRANHLEGVPLERDGDINKDFRQELILGNDDTRDPQKLDSAIRIMFAEADENKDGVLSSAELEKRIVNNTQSHLAESQQEAARLMTVVDTDANGQISWEEYLPHFLSEKGLHQGQERKVVGEDAAAQVEEELSLFKRSDDDKNEMLSDQEWLGFLHPEHSKDSLLDMAKEIIESFDRNGDGFVSRDEFSMPAPGEVEEKFRQMEEEEKQRKIEEFDRDLDTNGDGQATLDEFFNYINPKNPQHARREVDEMLSLADSNGDGGLSLDEMLEKAWLLETSALLDANRRLHDDL